MTPEQIKDIATIDEGRFRVYPNHIEVIPKVEGPWELIADELGSSASAYIKAMPYYHTYTYTELENLVGWKKKDLIKICRNRAGIEGTWGDHFMVITVNADLTEQFADIFSVIFETNDGMKLKVYNLDPNRYELRLREYYTILPSTLYLSDYLGRP